MTEGSVIALIGLAVALAVNLIAVGRWCGKMDALGKALFDEHGNNKIERLSSDVKVIRSKLENGLLGDIANLQHDMTGVKRRIDRMEVRICLLHKLDPDDREDIHPHGPV